MDMKTVSIGDLIDRMWMTREKKRLLNEKVAELDKDLAMLEADIQDRLAQENLDGGRGKKASVSVGEEIVANITDFDALCKYVKRTGYFHLFHRRISNPAFRELAAKKPVPGLEAFTKKKLNLTTLKGA